MSPVPPPPPPPPPPMPNFDLKNHRQQDDQSSTQHVTSSNPELGLEIDLVSPSGCVKPHMKMRTLNWRRVPKRRVLSHHLEKSHHSRTPPQDTAGSDSLSQMFRDMQIKSPSGKNQENATISSSDSSDDEETNIWFKIAKSNDTVKRVERPMPPSIELNTTQGQSDISQDTITNSGGSQPITSASSKSASRIREMLEAVRRRMAAVAAASSPATDSEITRTPTNDSHNNSSYLFQAYNLESKKASILSPRPTSKPKSVLEAMDFHDLESLFCLNTQPSHNHLDDDSNSSIGGNFVRRSSWRSTNAGSGGYGGGCGASSDSVISSNNSCDGFYLDHNHPLDSGHHSGDNYDEGDNREESIDFLSENILDSKKSLNVNIFLKQLKNPTELIEQINDSNNKLIGEERLQSILKLLPDDNEQVQLMKFYNRNKQHRLPVAERFLLELLVRVPNLTLKLKFMLVKEKYYNDIDEHIPSELDKIDGAIRELRKSRKFRDLLNLVLVTGNFLNSGGYAADAVGFSLDCLNRLHEVRSNREGIHLIHYIAEIAQKMHLVEFQRDELAHIESASRVCLESIKLDLVSMSERIHELKCDIDNARESNDDQLRPKSKEEDFISNLLSTLEDIKCNVDFLKKKVTQDLETNCKKLADYLCEDPVTFNLHECLSCIQMFSRRLKTAKEENERRLRLEMRKSSLKRSNTIHARLPKQATITSSSSTSTSRRQITNGRKSLGGGESLHQPAATQEPVYFDKTRASFGGYISSERRQSFSSKHANSIQSRTPLGPSGDIVRTSSTCSSIIKSSLSSLSSHNTSSFGNNSDCDDLHDGLMRLLNDSTSRRSSGPLRRFSGRSFGQ